MDLQGRVALVTGGSRRLGRAIVEALADAGCSVIIHYGKSRQTAEALAEELHARGVDAWCVGADLAVESEIAGVFQSVKERAGRLDVLVNSAATFEKRPFVDLTSSEWDRVMAVNLRAPFLCLQSALPLLGMSWRHGEVPAAAINIGDLSGELPWPGFSHHGASKAGLLHLTRVAARELAPQIRVNAVIPGPVLPPPDSSEESPDWQSLVGRIPAARRGWPAEVGESVLFLARNDFVFGETLHVDGGEHLMGAGHRQL